MSLLKTLLVLTLILGAIATGVALRIYEQSGPMEPVRPAATGASTTFPRLRVRVARSANRILVENVDEHAWTSCMVDVNAGVRGGSFSRELGDVDVGEEVELRLGTFTRADGRRFDPGAERVQVVDVHCDTPAGPARFTGGL